MGLNPPWIRANVPHVVDYYGTRLCLTINMEYSEMRQLIDESVEFPITHDSLVDQLGEVKITAPTGDSIPISDVLNRAGEPTYRSTNMLSTTIALMAVPWTDRFPKFVRRVL